MSEPMGCSDRYCQESAIPCLETVSEEARRHIGKYIFVDFVRQKIQILIYDNDFSAGPDGNDLSDYYFRDSFEHSSSDSGYTHYDRTTGSKRPHSMTADNLSFRLHHNHHHHPHQSNNAHSAAGATGTSTIATTHHPNEMKTTKQFSVLHAFVPSFVFVVVILTAVTIFIFESESDIFVTFKNLPEMMNLKYQYYQPFKNFILRRLGLKE